MNLKSVAKVILRPLVLAVRYIRNESGEKPPRHYDLYTVLRNRAADSSADYIEHHLGSANVFDARSKLWNMALSFADRTGLFLEFGVFEGVSINYFADLLASAGTLINGFDSFEGLKEQLPGSPLVRGSFDRSGLMPIVRSNVRLIKGWFEDTVPVFLNVHNEKISFVHFDADTYETTRFLLGLLRNRIQPGTVVIFDEYLGFPNWQNGEYRAWQEFIEDTGLTYKYLGFSPQQAAIIIN